MKRKYLNREEFIDFLEDLKVGEVKDICTESMEVHEYRIIN